MAKYFYQHKNLSKFSFEDLNGPYPICVAPKKTSK